MAVDAASRRGLHDPSPSPWIVRFAPHIPAGAAVLDLACGEGRHARYFANRGARVVAVDRDTEALGRLASSGGVETIAADLEGETWPLGGRRFDAIVVARYLHRPLFGLLLDALAADGLLLYETFAVGNERYGKPVNPDFLLRESELLDVVRERLVVIAFEQGVTMEATPSVIQRIAAVGRERERPLAIIPANARTQ